MRDDMEDEPVEMYVTEVTENPFGPSWFGLDNVRRSKSVYEVGVLNDMGDDYHTVHTVDGESNVDGLGDGDYEPVRDTLESLVETHDLPYTVPEDDDGIDQLFREERPTLSPEE